MQICFRKTFHQLQISHATQCQCHSFIFFQQGTFSNHLVTQKHQHLIGITNRQRRRTPITIAFRSLIGSPIFQIRTVSIVLAPTGRMAGTITIHDITTLQITVNIIMHPFVINRHIRKATTHDSVAYDNISFQIGCQTA